MVYLLTKSNLLAQLSSWKMLIESCLGPDQTSPFPETPLHLRLGETRATCPHGTLRTLTISSSHTCFCNLFNEY